MLNINDARAIIDRVNDNFAQFLAKTIPLPANTELKICETAKSKARKLINAGEVPEDFMDMIEQVSQRLESYARENALTYKDDDINEITGKLSDRYNALVPVAVHKDENGLLAYDKPQHKLVIDTAGERALKYGASFYLSRALAKIIANKSVQVQEPYLDDHTGPIAEMLDR